VCDQLIEHTFVDAAVQVQITPQLFVVGLFGHQRVDQPASGGSEERQKEGVDVSSTQR